MHKFSVSFIILFITWVLFTSSTNALELTVGLFISIIIAAICGKFMFYESPYRLFNPKSMINMIIYLIIFSIEEIKAHLKVASLIITGKTNPAIIKIPTGQATDFTKTLVANSITLTPGTLTLDISKDHNYFFIHSLNHTKNEDISSKFEKYAYKVM